MITGIILGLISLAVSLLLVLEVRRKNRCEICGTKLKWQDQGKELSPLGHEAVKQVGHCPKCQKDRQVKYWDDVYY